MPVRKTKVLPFLDKIHEVAKNKYVCIFHKTEDNQYVLGYTQFKKIIFKIVLALKNPKQVFTGCFVACLIMNSHDAPGVVVTLKSS